MARNPRLNVSVTPEQHELLLDLARLQGTSASRLIGELIRRTEPLFRALLPVLKASEAAQARFSAEVGRIGLEAVTETDGRQIDLEAFIRTVSEGVFADRQEASAPSETCSDTASAS